MTIGHNQTASGRPLRVAPAWVGAASPDDTVVQEHLPVREAVWIWSVRRYARLALWGLPVAAVLSGWVTLAAPVPPGPLIVRLTANWLAAVALIGLAGLLSGSRTRKSALLGLLIGIAGFLLQGVAAEPAPVVAAPMIAVPVVAASVSAVGWLLMGWSVFRSKLVNPADGILLILAAAAVGAGPHAPQPLPIVGSLLMLAAGTGLAWTGGRLLPRI